MKNKKTPNTNSNLKVTDENELFRICANGQVYHRGRLVEEQDLNSVIYGFKDMLKNIGFFEKSNFKH